MRQGFFYFAHKLSENKNILRGPKNLDFMRFLEVKKFRERY